MNIKATYNHALLSEAAYANFFDKDTQSVVTSDEKVKKALEAVPDPLSKTQIDEFLKDWEVVSHQPNTASGFSATLFKNKHTQEYLFSNRSTKLNILNDKFDEVVLADLFGITFLSV